MEEADYLIVGAGPAGCALAARLAAAPEKPSVILIEAGRPPGLRFCRSSQAAWRCWCHSNPAVITPSRPYRNQGSVVERVMCRVGVALVARA
ncbi:lycopene cyclase family protein [Agrobacterium rubi]|uniref:lycopene cyclase family protein n=1 Tax=Agrobacterium rubi TaxID=28099 RepID=UPI002286054C|nr:lycopene cyclase family protein [Agrobacterium rubi]